MRKQHVRHQKSVGRLPRRHLTEFGHTIDDIFVIIYITVHHSTAIAVCRPWLRPAAIAHRPRFEGQQMPAQACAAHAAVHQLGAHKLEHMVASFAFAQPDRLPFFVGDLAVDGRLHANYLDDGLHKDQQHFVQLANELQLWENENVRGAALRNIRSNWSVISTYRAQFAAAAFRVGPGGGGGDIQRNGHVATFTDMVHHLRHVQPAMWRRQRCVRRQHEQPLAVCVQHVQLAGNVQDLIR